MLFMALLICLALDLVISFSACRKTDVAIIGAGVAGITAAQALSNASVTDFLLIEYNGEIGGRVAHRDFGARHHEHTVELGANWVQGRRTGDGLVNPIWLLVQKYNLTNTYSNHSSVRTYNENGAIDYTRLLDRFDDIYTSYEEDAGYMLTQNLLDTSVRSALSLAGWRPRKNMMAQAVEWWHFDWEYSAAPEESSALFSAVNYNTTFCQYSDTNYYVFDPRGLRTIVRGEASTFLDCTADYDCNGDERLLLNTVVTNISHTDAGVTITNKDGSCIAASYTILTVSLGVLQNEMITFYPPLPAWKQSAIATFQMGTYTKIFLQFPPDTVFWERSTQFFLYADPIERGYYPIWQSLDGMGFLEGSGILFVTVVEHQSYRVEAQDDETTKEQVLQVLRDMYGAENVPDPIAFMYPRWSLEEWAFGSFSNWPPGTTLEQHHNLRANIGRLYYAGEATSTKSYGSLQGAWFEGQEAGSLVAECLVNGERDCSNLPHYPVLHGTVDENQLDTVNGRTALQPTCS